MYWLIPTIILLPLLAFWIEYGLSGRSIRVGDRSWVRSGRLSFRLLGSLGTLLSKLLDGQVLQDSVLHLLQVAREDAAQTKGSAMVKPRIQAMRLAGFLQSTRPMEERKFVYIREWPGTTAHNVEPRTAIERRPESHTPSRHYYSATEPLGTVMLSTAKDLSSSPWRSFADAQDDSSNQLSHRYAAFLWLWGGFFVCGLFPNSRQLLSSTSTP